MSQTSVLEKTTRRSLCVAGEARPVGGLAARGYQCGVNDAVSGPHWTTKNSCRRVSARLAELKHHFMNWSRVDGRFSVVLFPIPLPLEIKPRRGRIKGVRSKWSSRLGRMTFRRRVAKTAANCRPSNRHRVASGSRLSVRSQRQSSPVRGSIGALSIVRPRCADLQ
jgi:hypothetical protein